MPDFLFDPQILGAIDKVRKKTHGRFKWHHHSMRVFGIRAIAHSFDVYAIDSRGLPHVMRTDWSRDVRNVVDALSRLNLATLTDLECHGL